MLKPIVPQMNTSAPLLHTCTYACIRMLLCLHTIIIRCTPSSMSSMIIQYVITLLYITTGLSPAGHPVPHVQSSRCVLHAMPTCLEVCKVLSTSVCSAMRVFFCGEAVLECYHTPAFVDEAFVAMNLAFLRCCRLSAVGTCTLCRVMVELRLAQGPQFGGGYTDMSPSQNRRLRLCPRRLVIASPKNVPSSILLKQSKGWLCMCLTASASSPGAPHQNQ